MYDIESFNYFLIISFFFGAADFLYAEVVMIFMEQMYYVFISVKQDQTIKPK